jgi:hypothetical protein
MSDTLFTWGPANVTTLLTTTMENRDIKDIQDAVFNDLVLIRHLVDKNSVRRAGGASIIVPIRSAKNTTVGSYDGFQTIDVSPQEELTAAQYKWKQYAASISVSGREERIQNAGQYAVLDLVQSKIKGAEESLKDKINTDLFAAAQASTAIQTLVLGVDATTSVGDIASTTYSFWQSTNTTSGSFAAQGLSDMRTLWSTLEVKMPVAPTDLILTTTTIYNYYEGALTAQQRYAPADKTGNASFDKLQFRSAPVVYDAAATSGVMYFLNSKCMELVIHSGTDFIMRDWVPSINQDAKTALFMVGLELVIKNRRKLGKLNSITA